MTVPSARSVRLTAVLAVAYFGVARLGIAIGSLPGNVAPVWPAAGLALAAVVLGGWRLWPGIFLGELLVNGLGHVPWHVAAGMAAGNCLEAVAGAWLFQTVFRGDPGLRRTRDVLGLVVGAATLSTALSATIGVASLVLGGVVGRSGAWTSWQVWWGGDALGDLLVAPLVLLWLPIWRSSGWRLGLGRWRWRDSVLPATLAAAAAAYVAVGLNTGYPYAVFPLLMLASVRHTQRGATTASAAVALVAIWRTTSGAGFFARSEGVSGLWLLDSFLAMVAITMLVLASVVAERDEATADLRGANADLDVRVRETTATLEADRRRLADAQRVARVGSWEYDLVSGEVVWSDEMYRICGLDPREPITVETYRRLVHDDDVDDASKQLSDALAGRSPGLAMEYRVIRPDGQVRVVRQSGEVTRDAAGAAVRLTGVAQDVTEAVRAGSELRSSELRFRSLAAAVPVGVFQADGRGSYVYTNAYWRQTAALSESGALGSGWLDAVHPDERDDVANSWAAAVAAGTGYHRAVRLLLPDGRIRRVTIDAGPLAGATGDGGGFVGSMSDVTAQVDEQESMAAARDRALELSELKSRFLADMSHEIRTPMNGILGMASLLLDTPLDPMQRSYLRSLHTSARNMLDIVNDILDFSRIAEGRLGLEESAFELRPLVDGVLGLLAQSATGKGIDLQAELDDDLPSWFEGDAGRVRQVLTHLVANAVKFTRVGGVTVSVRTSRHHGAAQGVMFRVDDTGIGIAYQDQDRLFDEFTQVDETTTRAHGGSGLGLAISRQLVELMGGSLGVDSELGRGSTFWFWLPLRVHEAPEPRGGSAPVIPEQATQDAREHGRARGRVLVAEDNEVNQEVAAAVLRNCGYEVDVVSDGRAAVTAVARGGYCVVLMDCQMPLVDGYTATTEIRRLPSEVSRIPIIALTASALPADRERCLGAGMNDYLAKPVDPALLISILRQWDGGAATTEWWRSDGYRQDPRRHGRPKERAPLMPTGQPELPPAQGGDPTLSRAMRDRLGAEKFSVIAGVFRSSTPARLAEIRRRLDEGQTSDAGREAHSLAGSAATLGAVRLAQNARRVELACGEGELRTALSALVDAEREWELVDVALEELVASL